MFLKYRIFTNQAKKKKLRYNIKFLKFHTKEVFIKKKKSVNNRYSKKFIFKFFNKNFKKQINDFNLNRAFLKKPFIIKSLNWNSFKRKLNFSCYSGDGLYFKIDAFNNFFFGLLYYNYNASSFNFKKFEGVRLPLILLEPNFLLYNLESIKKEAPQYGRALKSSIKILQINWEFFKVLIQMPSKKIVWYPFNICCIYGTKIFINLTYFKIFKSKKPKVRGVAKNPYDHPNGGKSKSKKKWKTPWGRIIKK